METLITNTQNTRSDEVFRAAKTAIIDKDGRLLILWRSLTDDYRPGGADFPGGEVEENESDAEAVVREVGEETGLQLSVAGLYRVGRFAKAINEPGNPVSTVESTLFIARVEDQVVDLGTDGEHHAYQWMDPKEIEERELLKGSLSKMATLITVIRMQERGAWLPSDTAPSL